MMKPKVLAVLGGVLVVLALVSWATSRSKYSTAEGGGFEPILEASLDTGSVQSVKAWLGSSPDSSVELSRADEGWEVASRWGWPAKPEQVIKLFDDLAGLKGEKRASSEAVLGDFRIDDAGALHVAGFGAGGTELFHLLVGKGALRGGEFVRRNGSNDVYLTPARLASSFGIWGDEPKPPDQKRWINLQVHKAERTDVDRIVLRQGSREIAFEKVFAEVEVPPATADTSGAAADTAAAAAPAGPTIDRTKWTWKPDRQGPFDQSTVDGILSTLCSIYATDVVDPAGIADYGLGEEARVAELAFQDGTTKSIRFGKVSNADEGRVYFQVGDGDPAEIHKNTADRIFKERSEFSPKKET
ncbi:MAG: DUF4340 domain-containing protein [bacterium]